jgi:protein-disulfide isomerase
VASGSQTKRKRRAAVPAPPPSATARKASPRVLFIAGAALALLLVAGVLALVIGNRGDDSATQDVPAVGSLENGLPGAADVEQLLKGIPQSGDVLGAKAAPVTVVEYVDLQCPFCQQFEVEAMPTIVNRYVRTGKARIVMRPIAFIGPDSETGRKAVIGAGAQGKQFNLAQVLYLNQGPENSGWLDESMIAAAASSIPGLRVPELLEASDSAATSDKADEVDAHATRDRVRSTPTILVGKTGATPKQVTLSSPTDTDSVASAIDAALS